MSEIRRTAELLKTGWQDRLDRFAAKQDPLFRSWMFEHHAQQKKDCSVSEAGKHNDQDVRLKLFDPRAIEEIVPPRSTKWQIDQCEVSQGGRNEEKQGGGRSRSKLGQQKHFAPDRRQEVKMQAAFDHLATDEPREDTQAAKEDSQPDVVELDDARKHLGIVADRCGIVWINDGVNGNY